jgi:DNA-binding transcriptional regulator YdaS (Cro superfamily)
MAVLLACSDVSAEECTCPTIPASGRGNTSCSGHESNGHCTLDYNLFSPIGEDQAAVMLREAGLKDLMQPPNAPTPNVLALMQADPKSLVDAVLVYLFVAAAEQQLDRHQNMSEQVTQLVQALTPLRPQIASAFGREVTQRWLVPTKQINPQELPKSERLSDNRIVLAPGCIEGTVSGFWVMFKASWSPMRIRPRCEN